MPDESRKPRVDSAHVRTQDEERLGPCESDGGKVGGAEEGVLETPRPLHGAVQVAHGLHGANEDALRHRQT